MLRKYLKSKNMLALFTNFKFHYGTEKYSIKDKKSQNPREMKQYQKLFSNSIELSPRLPSSSFLKVLRAKSITRIMTTNHNIDNGIVLESHIECLEALISRVQPSIEGIAMLVQYIYKVLLDLSSENPQILQKAESKSLLIVMKSSLLTKLVRIAQWIQPYYNELLKVMMTVFMMKAIDYSKVNIQSIERQKLNLEQIKRLIHSKEKPVFTQTGQQITQKNLQKFCEQRLIQIQRDLPVLQKNDLLETLQYILGMGYYTQNLIEVAIRTIQNQYMNDRNDLMLTILKIRIIKYLQKFKNNKIVAQKNNLLFNIAYNNCIDRYFALLLDNKCFFEVINSENAIIQTQLIINEFLNKESYVKAKNVYLEVFNKIFDTMMNGPIYFDVKRLRGLFQVILIMYTHEDTPKIHQFLQKVERVMSVYPLQKFNRLQIHCTLSQKYGFKSDFFAERYLKELLNQKQKLQKHKGLIHHVHQVNRELHLASKFLIYLDIASKPSKENIDLASKLAYSLFDPNIWYCLSESDPTSQSFFVSASSGSFIYFTKANVPNLMSGQGERKKIENYLSQMKLRNLKKNYLQVFQQIYTPINRYNLKVDHSCAWKHNHHARMVTILQLALHSYQYLRRKTPQEAASFLQQFLNKTVNTTIFYNALKQKFAYPQIFELILQIMERSDIKQYPIQTRDIEAIKRLYAKQLTKPVKIQDQIFRIEYQPYLDVVEYNKVMLPYYQQLYGLSGIPSNTPQSLIYQAIKRYFHQKQDLSMQIQTYFKFRKTNGITVTINHLQYPHLADLKISQNDKDIVLLLRLADSQENLFLNWKQAEMQKQSQIYWKKRGYTVINLRSRKQIDEFVEKRLGKEFTEKEEKL